MGERMGHSGICTSCHISRYNSSQDRHVAQTKKAIGGKDTLLHKYRP